MVFSGQVSPYFSPLAAEAYQNHIHPYHKAVEYPSYPLEEVYIPFDGKKPFENFLRRNGCLEKSPRASYSSIGELIHHSFIPLWVDQFPVMLKKALGIIAAVDSQNDPLGFQRALLEQSVEKYQKFIPAQGSKAPLLYINGENDEVVPLEEIGSLKKIGMKLRSA